MAEEFEDFPKFYQQLSENKSLKKLLKLLKVCLKNRQETIKRDFTELY
jgi:hypothetical protein